MATPLITKVLIDYAYPNRDLNLLLLMLALGVVIFFFNLFFNNVTNYLDSFIHQKLSIDLKKKFYDHLQKLPMAFLYEKQIGDLMVRINDDIESVVDAVSELIPVIVQTFLRLVSLLAICFSIDRSLTLLALLGIPVYFVQTNLFVQHYADVRKRVQEKEADIYAFYQEKIGNIKMIKSFNQGLYEGNRLAQKLTEMFQLMRENMFVRMINSFMDNSLIKVWTTVIAGYAGIRVISGHMSIGELMAVTIYLGQIHQPFMDFGEIYKSVNNSIVSMNRIDEVLSAEPEAYHDLKTFILYNMDGKICFDNVSFKYGNSDREVLSNITFEALPGTTTAFVGMSGAGKSTIIDLMQRFNDPTSGAVMIDNYNIKQISLISLRANISIVSQGSDVFTGTILENITYGTYGSKTDMNRVIESAKCAEIHDFIMALPDQYETKIGEGGVGLSGGQKQRLTIARAVYRNVKILILDEATSALDVVSEHKILENFKKHTKNKTVIIITHRVTSVQTADKILVIKNNLIHESGTFNELMDKKGEFYSFNIVQERTREATAPPDPAADLESFALIKEMEGELSDDYQLSDDEKKVLALFYVENKSFLQIGKALNIPTAEAGKIKKESLAKVMMRRLLASKEEQ